MNRESHRSILIVGAERAADDAACALRHSGYDAERVGDPAIALARLLANGFELVLVAGLAGNRGDARLRLCAAIRESCGPLPILLLGASERERDAVGRPAGPDDYVVREFDSNEIQTRARVLIERALEQGDSARTSTALACGPLRLDPGNRSVSFDRRSAPLTAIEYRLLRHLAQSPGRAASRGELLHAVWGYEHDGYAQTLTTHVNRLRTKLEKRLGAPRLVETVRGLGYRFTDSIGG